MTHPNGVGVAGPDTDTDQDQDGLLITFPSKIPSFSPHARAAGLGLLIPVRAGTD